MKKIFLGSAFLLLACLTNVTAQNATAAKPAQVAAAPAASKAVFTIAADTYDFGNIPQGTPVTHVFSFKNTGTEPLVLTNVQASCGCTTPEWPREPITPGASASIKVTYNAQAMGVFNKPVTVTFNAEPNQKVLMIKGDVKPVQTNASVPAPIQKQPAPKKN